MTSFLVETDVLIDLLRGYAPAVEWMRELQNQPLISVITVAELCAGMRAGEERALETLFDASVVIPVGIGLPGALAICDGNSAPVMEPGWPTPLSRHRRS